jgi:CspA family cold shock protein
MLNKQGTVKWFNNKKGYGFIVFGEDADAIVHHSEIKMDGFRTLKEGQPVMFDLVDNNGKLAARNVRVVNEDSKT